MTDQRHGIVLGYEPPHEFAVVGCHDEVLRAALEYSKHFIGNRLDLSRSDRLQHTIDRAASLSDVGPDGDQLMSECRR
jgi:hypothetical protein